MDETEFPPRQKQPSSLDILIRVGRIMYGGILGFVLGFGIMLVLTAGSSAAIAGGVMEARH